MHPIKFSLCLLLLVAAVGCLAIASEEIPASGEPTLLVHQTDPVEAVTSVPTQTPFLEVGKDLPASATAGASGKDDRMPVFVEITQITVMGNNSAQGPTIGVGPVLYFYVPESKILMLQPTVSVESQTDVIVGVATLLQTPAEEYEQREIVQYPAKQPGIFQILFLSKDTGTVELVYGNESFSLSPGESRTFKQTGSGSKTPARSTIISNYGYLSEIQPNLTDGSTR